MGVTAPKLIVIDDPIFGRVVTVQCSKCDMGIFVDEKNPPLSPLTCWTCQEKDGVVFVKEDDTFVPHTVH